MKSLFPLWATIPMGKDSLDGDSVPFCSLTVTVQLRFVIGQAIVPLELELLSKIDKVVQGSDSIDRKSPLALWACIWILILCYKEHMILTKVWLDRGEPPIWQFFLIISLKIDGQQLHGLTSHMYNALTSIYAALYKTTSPLTFDWRKEEVSTMLGGDDELIRLFCIIKTEMFWFGKSRDYITDSRTPGGQLLNSSPKQSPPRIGSFPKTHSSRN